MVNDCSQRESAITRQDDWIQNNLSCLSYFWLTGFAGQPISQ